MRLDVYLAHYGHTESRSRAAFLIENGAVTVNDKVVRRAAQVITENCTVAVLSDMLPYVSRGGLKLAGAIADFELQEIVQGAIVLDVGTSTGGFADCLLRHGASKVYGVDIGKDQLHHTLRGNPKLISLENQDIRSLTTNEIREKCNLCTIDVSFTSQTLLYPSILPFLSDDAILVSLIKPQFEAGRKALTKSGKIKTSALLKKTVEQVTEAAALQGLQLIKTAPSRQAGGEGTAEWFGLFKYKN